MEEKKSKKKNLKIEVFYRLTLGRFLRKNFFFHFLKRSNVLELLLRVFVLLELFDLVFVFFFRFLRFYDKF